MAHAYSNVVMDKIEECIKNGLSGNENEDWELFTLKKWHNEKGYISAMHDSYTRFMWK